MYLVFYHQNWNIQMLQKNNYTGIFYFFDLNKNILL